MAQQSSFYFTDGTTRTYPSSKHIASKQHVAVYFKSVATSTWSIIEAGLYDLVNNSIVFIASPDNVLYSQIEIRVADTAAELTDSPSDIATVASDIVNVNTVATNIASVNTVSTNIASVTTVSGSIANVNTVAGSIANVNTVAGSIANVNTVATNILDVVSVADTVVPNIAEILLADDNAVIATTQAGIATTQAGLSSTSATNAQLRAWEAEAEKLTADSYATEAEDVFVKIYTSDGDGTFTATPTTEYSSLHWAAKSLASAQDTAVNVSYGNISSGLTATNVQTAIDELSLEKISASDIHAATSKTTPADADELPLLDSAASFVLKKLTWANLKAAILAFFTTNNQTFSAYAGASQNLTTNVFTKIQFNTEEFDTAGAYDSTTNYRFQPTVAGYYLINVYVALSTSTTITDYQAVIYKNGTAFKTGDRVSGVAGSNVRASATALVLMNGTTDYVEGYMFAVSTGTLPTTAGANNTYFQATLVRGV